MNPLVPRDYSQSGLDIQSAIQDFEKKHGPQMMKGRRPPAIAWGALTLQTSDVFDNVPTEGGRLRLELISAIGDVKNGVDLAMRGGVIMPNGDPQPQLRVWYDPGELRSFEWDFTARDGCLSSYNVYEIPGPPRSSVGYWTKNAGFWIEPHGPLDRTYHCSHAECEVPNFESFVYRITITTRGAGRSRYDR